MEQMRKVDNIFDLLVVVVMEVMDDSLLLCVHCLDINDMNRCLA